MDETVFTYAAPQLKFGRGAVDEIGYDVAQLAASSRCRVLIVTDAGVAATGAPQRVAESVAARSATTGGAEVVVYDGVHVEPTDDSMRAAVDFARTQGPWDVVVAVGGGSSIDTAKAVALLISCPGDLLEYVNPPIGAGRTVQGPLTPLVAVPTTTGTGSESTTVCVLDVLSQQVKTGISHARLRPVLAVVDPGLTESQPPEVTACSGMDVLCHALESYTARPYTSFERKRPEQRVPYCGSNPVADVWAERALQLMSRSFRTAVGVGTTLATGNDDAQGGRNLQARDDVALAATVAGMGFGNAGVHVPHANGYPLAGRVKNYHPPGYPGAAAMVPHGMSVALTAPQAFRFTFKAAPERHLRAGELLAPGCDIPDNPADHLPRILTKLMRDVGMPAGIGAIGYGEDDIPALVAGSLQQKRLLATCPRDVTTDDLAGIFARSIENW